MISRLTTIAVSAAATITLVATASLAFAAEARHERAAAPLKTVQLERVVIIAKRLPAAAR